MERQEWQYSKVKLVVFLANKGNNLHKSELLAVPHKPTFVFFLNYAYPAKLIISMDCPPILTLPVDVLLEILLITYLSKFPFDFDFGYRRKERQRRHLSQVCKSWRAAISADLTKPFDHSDPLRIPPDQAREVFPYLAKNLARSRDLPLSIHMDIDRQDLTMAEFVRPDVLLWTRAHFRALGGILLPYTARFQQIRIISPNFESIELLLSSFVDHNMPLLEYVDCHRDTTWRIEPPLPEPGSSCFANSAEVPPALDLNTRLFPRLSKLSLTSFPLLWSQFIPRYGLVSLDLNELPEDHRPTFAELKNMLCSQKSLQKLRLQNTTPMPDFSIGPDDKIVLPDLKELLFNFEVDASSFFFIQHSEFPSLTSLLLTQITDPDSDRPDSDARVIYRAMTEFWRPTLGQISHLTLQNVEFGLETRMELNDAELAFFQNRAPTFCPVMISFFFACCSLKFLKLWWCDDYTLACLAIPVYTHDADPPAVFPCRDLERLEITMHQIQNRVVDWLRGYTFWLNMPKELVTPRKVNVMVLNFEPVMGSLVKELIKPNMAVEFRNEYSGNFLVHGVEGEVENLMDHVRA
ncbi:hypothetical protein GYMLUDRAFT_249162 [Collybiopsis luxurians FD-317 M1]|uniref:F-box domain-containing protein n=1 Tax=Collybiopsis luxurians FD-317 M1 TaxID=944289 RepID=A0A0D0BY91_9AGAR|nr:hypothetical protein GYMLUDRAFT_249162 [Collybiopsis luxurians FD-317 M1]